MTLKAYIVEDNAVIRDNLVETLGEVLGVETVGHSSTESDACRWLDQHPKDWDMLILDLFLAQGTGLGVLQKCGHHRKNQRVVVLSNYATEEVRKRCLVNGADAVFDKSTEIDLFLQYCSH
ncbi:MAG TPA: response regulator [Polaromonas sp.]|uniref:response regulator n=1 Tax=Polaromonas sp. TaxID=1869339 RepID=UPI002D2D85C0|nr:response regulator [Polaromonas sp.]HYW56571.1 response regulator [Polaromonas sp.]